MKIEKQKILVLGASGLLGNMVFRVLSNYYKSNVYGTVRSKKICEYFSYDLVSRLIAVGDLTSPNVLNKLIENVQPTIIINCISVGRPIPSSIENLLPLLSLLPRRLSYLCDQRNIRLVQISSDAVFSGEKGFYSEEDIPDARDAYGLCKLLGQVGYPAVTLRTSLLGPELESKLGLLEWFLSQTGECKGYSKAIFSGVTTLELGVLLAEVIIPKRELSGVFHVSSSPCSKMSLLKMIKVEYGLKTSVVTDDSFVIDRSLSGEKLKNATGYYPPKWEEMLHSLHNYKFGLRN